MIARTSVCCAVPIRLCTTGPAHESPTHHRRVVHHESCGTCTLFLYSAAVPVDPSCLTQNGTSMITMTFQSCTTFILNQADTSLTYCRTDWVRGPVFLLRLYLT